MTGRTGQRERCELRRFVMIGASPHTDWLPGDVLRDHHGFILTGCGLPGEDPAGASRPVPLPLGTSAPAGGGYQDPPPPPPAPPPEEPPLKPLPPDADVPLMAQPCAAVW
jgi:hypothetical protein